MFSPDLSAGPIGTRALWATAIACVAIAARVARERANDRPLGRTLVVWLSLGWFFVVSTILLVPRHTAEGDGQCSFALHRIAVFSYDLERLLNVVMFVPGGLLCVYLGRTNRQRLLFGAAVLAMPPLFELVQATGLVGRTCSATDVVDNWTGAVLGMAISAASMLVVKRKQHASIGE